MVNNVQNARGGTTQLGGPFSERSTRNSLWEWLKNIAGAIEMVMKTSGND